MKITVIKQVGDVLTTKIVEDEAVDVHSLSGEAYGSYVDILLARLAIDENRLAAVKAEKAA